MILDPSLRNNFIAVLLFSFSVSLSAASGAAEEPVEETLETARKQFYAAIEDKKLVDPTLKLFDRVAELAPEYTGRAQVYIGALFALKGKHAFFPHTKLKWVRRGLKTMDAGLEQSPDDLEALFIHGTTCYYLPFFFRRGDDAQRDFREIIKLLPQNMDMYDPELIRYVVVFLLANAALTDPDKVYLQTLRDGLVEQP